MLQSAIQVFQSAAKVIPSKMRGGMTFFRFLQSPDRQKAWFDIETRTGQSHRFQSIR